MPNDTAVLIAGAGPTGLTLASELTRRGIACRLIEQNAEPSPYSRALGVQARTLELLQNMGLADEFISRGHRVRGGHLFAGDRTLAQMHIDDLDSPFPFVLILAQSETERLLTQNLARLGGAVERAVTLTGFTQDAGGVTATLRHADGSMETMQAKWLVGCDGAHSIVRHTLGLPFNGAPYPEGWMLTDVGIRGTLPENEISIYITPQGLVGVFPFGQERFRLIGDNPLSESANPTLADWQATLDARGPGGLTLHDPQWATSFRIHRRIVDRLQQGRVFVAGDAAHIHSPAGGQGMNTGIQDAFNLAWKLALVVQGASPPSLLATYHLERYPVEQGILRGTDLLTRMMTMSSPPLIAARDFLMPLLSRLAPMRRTLGRNVSQIGLSYRNSPLVGEDTHSVAFRTGPAPGDRAPDAPLSAPGAVFPTTRLYDLLRGTTHTLLLLTGRALSPADKQTLTQIRQSVQTHFGAHIRQIWIVRGADIPAGLGGGAWLDPDGALHRRYAAQKPCLYLIRPDGYIGFRGQPPAWEPLQAHLSAFLLSPAG